MTMSKVSRYCAGADAKRGREGGDRTQVTKIDPDATHANTKGVARTFLLGMKILECAIPVVTLVSFLVHFGL